MLMSEKIEFVLNAANDVVTHDITDVWPHLETNVNYEQSEKVNGIIKKPHGVKAKLCRARGRSIYVFRVVTFISMYNEQCNLSSSRSNFVWAEKKRFNGLCCLRMRLGNNRLTRRDSQCNLSSRWTTKPCQVSQECEELQKSQAKTNKS